MTLDVKRTFKVNGSQVNGSQVTQRDITYQHQKPL